MRIVMALVLFSVLTPAVQYCCGPVLRCRERYFLACNLFCCACDGCKDSRGKRSAADEPRLRFGQIDANADGVITEEEGRHFLLNGTSSASDMKIVLQGKWFEQMDTNGDGFIQLKEFDKEA